MNHLKPIPLFTHKNAILPPSIPPPPKEKKEKKKTQVISVGVNPQRPNTVLDPLAMLLTNTKVQQACET